MKDYSAQLREDIELAALILAGNSDAEEKFDSNYRLWIRGIIRREGVPETDVEDVTQEVLLAAFDQMRRGKYRGESLLEGWLRKIVHGKVNDFRRKQPPRRLQLSSGANSSEGEQLEEVQGLPSVNIDPELVIAVHEVLRQMPEKLKLVLVLNRTCGYTLQEISNPLALTAGQAASYLYKAEEFFRCSLDTSDREVKNHKEKRKKRAARRKRLKGRHNNFFLLYQWVVLRRIVLVRYNHSKFYCSLY